MNQYHVRNVIDYYNVTTNEYYMIRTKNPEFRDFYVLAIAD